MDLIAHRGASYDAPENTLAAIQLGWRQGADAVEVDVRLSQEGEIVVIHDATTKRTARRAESVSRQTLAELKTLDAGCWKHWRWSNERIPTLAEALATLPAGKRLLVEIKTGPEIVPPLVKLVRRLNRASSAQIVPIGFSLETMATVKKRLPALAVYWVVEFRRDRKNGGWRPKLDHLIQRARQAGLDGLDVSARGPLTAATARRIHAAGLKLFVWTVDSPATARRLAALGVDGLATNRPGWLREQLKRP